MWKIGDNGIDIIDPEGKVYHAGDWIETQGMKVQVKGDNCPVSAEDDTLKQFFWEAYSHNQMLVMLFNKSADGSGDVKSSELANVLSKYNGNYQLKSDAVLFGKNSTLEGYFENKDVHNADIKLLTDATTTLDERKANKDELALKQDATDNDLNTTNKTIVGAINEVNAKPSGDPNPVFEWDGAKASATYLGTAFLIMNEQQIYQLRDPDADSDATTKRYVDNKITFIFNQLMTLLPDKQEVIKQMRDDFVQEQKDMNKKREKMYKK